MGQRCCCGGFSDDNRNDPWQPTTSILVRWKLSQQGSSLDEIDFVFGGGCLTVLLVYTYLEKSAET
jgi:hypothetical protein